MEQEEDQDEKAGWKRAEEEKGHRGVKRGETTELVALDASNHTNKRKQLKKECKKGANPQWTQKRCIKQMHR
eukprot:1017479-Ditylum_brightwellii.AAC.1